VWIVDHATKARARVLVIVTVNLVLYVTASVFVQKHLIVVVDYRKVMKDIVIHTCAAHAVKVKADVIRKRIV
jgi:hypothetical protein